MMNKCVRLVMLAVTLTCWLVVANPSLAQSQNTVTIKFDADDADDDAVTGELLSFEDNMFRIQTSVGLIVAAAEGTICIGAACPPGATGKPSGAPIALTSLDGDVFIRGTFVEVFNGQYVVATEFGEMKIDVDKATCEGTRCVPQADAFEFGGDVVLIGEGSRIEGVLVDQIDDAFIVEVPTLGPVRVSKTAYTCEGDGCP